MDIVTPKELVLIVEWSVDASAAAVAGNEVEIICLIHEHESTASTDHVSSWCG